MFVSRTFRTSTKALALTRRLEAIRDRLSGLETEENIPLAHEQRFSTMVDQSVPDWLETGFSGEPNQRAAGSGIDVSGQNAVVLDWQSSGQAVPGQGDDVNPLPGSQSRVDS